MIKYQTFSNSQKELQKPCVATIGKFDGVHAGHRKLFSLLKKQSKLKKLVSTVITFDPHPKKYFDEGFQNLQSLDERINDISEFGIDQVIVLEFNEFLENLSAKDFFEQVLLYELNVTILIVGEDFAFGNKRDCDTNCLKSLCLDNNVQLEIVSKLKEKGEVISSSRIREAKFTK